MKDAIIARVSQGKRVWLTGHSKGGAMATTAAAHLICGQISDTLAENLAGLSVVTFSSALVFKTRFANVYDDALSKFKIQHIRIQHKGDIVPRVPCFKGLSHVGMEEEVGQPFSIEEFGGTSSMGMATGTGNITSSIMDLLSKGATAAVAAGLNHSLDAIDDNFESEDHGSDRFQRSEGDRTTDELQLDTRSLQNRRCTNVANIRAARRTSSASFPKDICWL